LALTIRSHTAVSDFVDSIRHTPRVQRRGLKVGGVLLAAAETRQDPIVSQFIEEEGTNGNGAHNGSIYWLTKVK
jgi:hypothetical protein